MGIAVSRLEDLVTLRRERDQLQTERDSLTAANADLTLLLNKNEALFKKTLDADRTKLRQELQARSSRVKALEADKQELLGETSQLLKQVGQPNLPPLLLRVGPTCTCTCTLPSLCAWIRRSKTCRRR